MILQEMENTYIAPEKPNTLLTKFYQIIMVKNFVSTVFEFFYLVKYLGNIENYVKVMTIGR